MKTNKFIFVLTISLFCMALSLPLSAHLRADEEANVNPALFNRNAVTSSCIPGNPGYPYCIENPAVAVISQEISRHQTARMDSEPLLPVWSQANESMKITENVHISSQLNDIEFNSAFTGSSSFQVPAGKEGNIVYRTSYTVIDWQMWITLQDGTVVKGTTYQTIEEVPGDGTYYPIYRNN